MPGAVIQGLSSWISWHSCKTFPWLLPSDQAASWFVPPKLSGTKDSVAHYWPTKAANMQNSPCFDMSLSNHVDVSRTNIVDVVTHYFQNILKCLQPLKNDFKDNAAQTIEKQTTTAGPIAGERIKKNDSGPLGKVKLLRPKICLSLLFLRSSLKKYNGLFAPVIWAYGILSSFLLLCTGSAVIIFALWHSASQSAAACGWEEGDLSSFQCF